MLYSLHVLTLLRREYCNLWWKSLKGSLCWDRLNRRPLIPLLLSSPKGQLQTFYIEGLRNLETTFCLKRRENKTYLEIAHA
jgi:hypothetical protein